MTLNLVVDNDVLIKCACYAMLDQIQSSGGREEGIGILGAARYVVRSYLGSRGQITDRQAAQARFDTFLAATQSLEPTEEELRLATEIEEKAIELALDLDGGESQLCAIAALRSSPRVLTGDKRAIKAAQSLYGGLPALASLCRRIVCLEQAIIGVTNQIGIRTARSLVCAEPQVDRSITICFECNADDDREFSLEGLKSYVNDLRVLAPTLLYDRDEI